MIKIVISRHNYFTWNSHWFSSNYIIENIFHCKLMTKYHSKCEKQAVSKSLTLQITISLLVCKQNKWVVYPISFSYSQLTRENSYSSFFNVLMWNKPIIYKSQNNTNNKLEWMHFADFGMMCMETKRNKIFPLMI